MVRNATGAVVGTRVTTPTADGTALTVDGVVTASLARATSVVVVVGDDLVTVGAGATAGAGGRRAQPAAAQIATASTTPVVRSTGVDGIPIRHVGARRQIHFLRRK